jgi:short-subunit dehydrogenase
MTMKQVVLITGASSGIGRVTSELFVKQGYTVFGTSRSDKAKLAEGVHPIVLDVTDATSVNGAVKTMLRQTGRIDVVVNNAGYGLSGAVEETSIDEAKAQFETNFFGLARVVNEILPTMRQQTSGRIINISSVVGFLPSPYMAYYAASKHAVEGYTESLDHEVRTMGIRAISIEPAFTKTAFESQTVAAVNNLSAFAEGRSLAAAALKDGISKGADPLVVAKVIWTAATATKPKPRYQAGGQARFLSMLRNYAPTAPFDSGVRKSFGLHKLGRGTLQGRTQTASKLESH